MSEQRIGIYPGTFDPITSGHCDIVRRALRLVDKLVVGVASNAGKGPAFSLDERIEMTRGDLKAFDPEGSRIEVRAFDQLLMHFAEDMNAAIIVRGLRAVSDFDFEFQMTGMNARLNPNVETVFLMASESHQFISSRFVKEIAELGGDITSFVSPNVAGRLAVRYKDGS
ncbi:MAG: Phosphopantetheine adenylyltransferase [Alphaproteobacteria bacterium MarineAlpha10_Bin2]|nr:MAG: Phosphopantetheine adenylyltransferase [Alphaproteobacteria bacterium MarineAlpha10_Bin2]HIM44790.1 pantetheine-phosphate adenylyltransferase [Alphaproteobacteria bacterium]